MNGIEHWRGLDALAGLARAASAAQRALAARHAHDGRDGRDKRVRRLIGTIDARNVASGRSASRAGRPVVSGHGFVPLRG